MRMMMMMVMMVNGHLQVGSVVSIGRDVAFDVVSCGED